MSYNGSGTFNINTTGQPVVAGTVISSSAFNSLTNDLAIGLTTAITKDGQTTTTARITFAQGITSSLVTDSSSVSTGSIITGGGVGIAKNLYVGGIASFSAQPIFTSLTASSAVATDASKGLVSVTNTGTGNNVLATSPTLVTPALGTPASGVMTNVTGINYDGYKNRLINSAMVIDQRNAGASVSGNGVYTLDRWYAQASVNSKYTVQQNAGSVTPPAGFANYLGVTSSSAYTVGASENFSLLQAIEGYNMADFAWGTASASSVTLSFRVYSSLTGTFGGSLQNSAQNRSYPFTYTISSANTWTTISVTIAGDQSGTWLKTNGAGIYMWVGLGVGATVSGTAGSWSGSNYVGATGATSVVGTNGATFYITGVQLEKGSTATSFDYRPYGTELALAQRYYFKFSSVSSTSYFTTGWAESTTVANGVVNFPVQLRTNPTALEQSGTATDYRIVDLGSGIACNAVPAFVGSQSANTALVRFGVASGLTAGRCVGLSANSSTAAFLAWSAEL